MSGGPSQPKVIGEEWNDERIKSFLEMSNHTERDPDYHVLREAYEYMVAPDFARFVGFFDEAGRNINALDPEGHTILDRVASHKKSGDYATVLQEAGAKKSVDL